MIARLKTGRLENSRGSSSKSWLEYSRQQRYNKKKNLAKNVQSALSFCEDEGFKPCSVEIENVDTGSHELLNVACGTYSGMSEATTSEKENVHSVLYVKDKFSVSNEAFHELSMLSNLPSSSKVKNLTRTLNSQFDIRSAPNGIVGVQQSLRACVMLRLTQLVESSKGVDIPSTIRVKLTGDGTEIARGLSVVNINFTVLEEGQRACSAFGNHSIAILKVSENHEDLAAGCMC